MTGQVIRVIAGFYDVLTDGREYRVRGSGNLRMAHSSPLVGDFVKFNEDGMVIDILARENFMVRPKVANVDQAVIVMSLKTPDYSSFLLNKMLASVESQKIKPMIILTKIDLASPLAIKNEYEHQGYEVFSIDNLSYEGVARLRAKLRHNLTVFMGQTGAGKTSAINALLGLMRQTQETSKALGRGKHTTRVVQIEALDDLRIIDTPGFSNFELALSKLELARAFHDFAVFSLSCKYRSCLHAAEPESDCAVKQAVKKKFISQTRYDDYVKMLGEIN